MDSYATRCGLVVPSLGLLPVQKLTGAKQVVAALFPPEVVRLHGIPVSYPFNCAPSGEGEEGEDGEKGGGGMEGGVARRGR